MYFQQTLNNCNVNVVKRKIYPPKKQISKKLCSKKSCPMQNYNAVKHSLLFMTFKQLTICFILAFITDKNGRGCCFDVRYILILYFLMLYLAINTYYLTVFMHLLYKIKLNNN